jgi:hypothetical protein
MKRIQLYYDGVRYTVGGKDFDDLKREIESALASGAPHWLKVNHGEGTLRETEILIAPGVGIGLMPIEPDAEDHLPPAAVTLPGDIA